MKYLIVETAYEYNDEYYTTGESDGYTIHSKLKNTLEEAKEELKKTILDTVKTGFNFAEYYIEDSAEAMKNYINSIVPEGEKVDLDDYYEILVPESFTEEQRLKLYQLSGLTFYQIIKIEE